MSGRKTMERVAGWPPGQYVACLLGRPGASAHFWPDLLGLRVAASIDSLMELCWAGGERYF